MFKIDIATSQLLQIANFGNTLFRVTAIEYTGGTKPFRLTVYITDEENYRGQYPALGQETHRSPLD